jgi:hypothetical protein
MDALAIQKKQDCWLDPKYIPHAATWLNGRRWQDQSSSVPAAPAPKSTEERIAEMKRESDKLYASKFGSN